jgi:hypothetical protein
MGGVGLSQAQCILVKTNFQILFLPYKYFHVILGYTKIFFKN